MAELQIITVADGVHAQVITRRELPTRLEALLGELRLVREVAVPRITGTRRACTEGEHDLRPWRQGLWRERELRLSVCPHCGAIEVRDVSLDILPGVMAGRGGPRRRSDVMGWYSGKRPRGREYR